MRSLPNRLFLPPILRVAAAGLAVAVAAVAFVAVGGRPGDTPATTSPIAPSSGPPAVASPTSTPSTTQTPAATSAPSVAEQTESAVASVSAAPTPTPTRATTQKPSVRPAPTPSSTAHGWQPSAALTAAKAEGRVVVNVDGVVSILPSAPPTPSYPRALTLDTTWTGLVQEPPPTGVDDAGRAYRDDNYGLLCGPGAAAVALYYWSAARTAVTTRSGSFTEPVNVGTNRYATTTWAASDAGGNGRGMIMYLAEVAWPAPDRGQPWWKAPGMMTWSARPPSTDIWNLADAINWEASGGTSVSYFYSIVSASDLTQAALQAHVHADIAAGVPVVIAARTSNGFVSLPFWRLTSTRNAANHFVTVVGYDDVAGTYTTIDTCGKGCNSTGTRSGGGRIGQAALYALIRGESDNDGILW